MSHVDLFLCMKYHTLGYNRYVQCTCFLVLLVRVFERQWRDLECSTKSRWWWVSTCCWWSPGDRIGSYISTWWCWQRSGWSQWNSSYCKAYTLRIQLVVYALLKDTLLDFNHILEQVVKLWELASGAFILQKNCLCHYLFTECGKVKRCPSKIRWTGKYDDSRRVHKNFQFLNILINIFFLLEWNVSVDLF